MHSRVFQLLAVLAILALPCFCGAQQTTSVPAGPDDSIAIVHLKQQLRGNRAVALKQFWKEVARTGAPLIESVPGDKNHSFVTFLWRGGDETRNVVIFDGIAGF